jgi:sulfur carrier protein
MRVVLNGETREVPDALTVAELVEREAPDLRLRTGRGVAVAVDAEVVPRGEWERTRISEGQRVELLAAIQGGAH